MAPKIHKIFKRQAEDEEYVDEEPTTIATKIFGKHLHKVKITTPTTTIEAEEEDTEAPTTVSTLKKIEKVGGKVTDFVSEKAHIPPWAVVAIFVLILLIILGICGFCIRRFFKKRRSKDGKKGMKGVDMKSVQLLGL